MAFQGRRFQRFDASTALEGHRTSIAKHPVTAHFEVVMKTRRTDILVVCFTFLLSSTAVVRAENWPGFRGPTGQGISTENNLPLNWSYKENIA